MHNLAVNKSCYPSEWKNINVFVCKTSIHLKTGSVLWSNMDVVFLYINICLYDLATLMHFDRWSVCLTCMCILTGDVFTLLVCAFWQRMCLLNLYVHFDRWRVYLTCMCILTGDVFVLLVCAFWQMTCLLNLYVHFDRGRVCLTCMCILTDDVFA